jgi:hypothetical protein
MSAGNLITRSDGHLARTFAAGDGHLVMMPSFPLAEKTATLTLQREKDVQQSTTSFWPQYPNWRAAVMGNTIALLNATSWGTVTRTYISSGVEWWYEYPAYYGVIYHNSSFFDTKAVYSGFMATVKLNLSALRYTAGTGAFNVSLEPMASTTDGLGGTYSTTRSATGDFTFSNVRLSRYLRVSAWITNWDFPTTEGEYSYFELLNTLKYTITGV